jgi:hypothetical protein
LRVPNRGFDAPTSVDEDDTVIAARAVMEAALPPGITEILEDPVQSSAIEQARDEEQNEEAGARKLERKRLETAANNKQLIRNMKTLVDRIAPDLDKSSEVEPPDEDAPEEAQEAYVSEYIRSSLNVAFQESKQRPPAFPALVYNRKAPTYSSADDNIESDDADWNSQLSQLPLTSH